MEEKLLEHFYGKELQKTIQEEFRIEKVIKRKSDKFYVKLKGCNNSFESWIKKRHWDTSTSNQVSNCDGFVLVDYLDHKFQEICKAFAVETLQWSLELVIQINL